MKIGDYRNVQHKLRIQIKLQQTNHQNNYTIVKLQGNHIEANSHHLYISSSFNYLPKENDLVTQDGKVSHDRFIIITKQRMATQVSQSVEFAYHY